MPILSVGDCFLYTPSLPYFQDHNHNLHNQPARVVRTESCGQLLVAVTPSDGGSPVEFWCSVDDLTRPAPWWSLRWLKVLILCLMLVVACLLYLEVLPLAPWTKGLLLGLAFLNMMVQPTGVAYR